MHRTARLAVLVAFAIGLREARAEPPKATPSQALLDRVAPSIVGIKMVWRTPTREAPYEVRGVVVDASGLVLTAAENVAPKDAQVENLRVVVPGEATERPAVVAAKDTDTQLAYVQILEVGAKGLPALDLASGVEPRVGQDVVSVWRDHAVFDYAPWLLRGYVTARVERPRLLYATGGDNLMAGLPAFDEAGRLVGVVIREGAPESTVETGTGLRPFLLPVADVARSLAAARKRVPDVLARARRDPAAASDPAPKRAAPAGSDPRDAK